MSESVSSQDNTNTLNVIPEGRPKSGRTWKKKQVFRTSSQNRKGVLSHLCKTYEQRQMEREKLLSLKTYEKELKEQTKQKKIERRIRREDNQKRRMANELKSAVYQQINPEKIKGMSKKQLRSIKKTSMNKNGQVELVSPYGN